MQSFYQFYNKMLKETGNMPAAPGATPGQPAPGQPNATPPIQGGQTSPSIPPNPMSNPQIAQAMKILQGVQDPNFQKNFQQFQKAAGIQTQGSQQQNGGTQQSQAQSNPTQPQAPQQAAPSSQQQSQN